MNLGGQILTARTARTKTERREERSKHLVDWGTAIFAVFWSVWWANVADCVLSNPKGLLIFQWEIPAWFVAGIMAVYSGLFTYSYVQWMWLARDFRWEIQLRPFLDSNWRLWLVVAGLVAASYVLYRQSQLSESQFVYGALLTGSWIATMMAILLRSDKWP